MERRPGALTLTEEDRRVLAPWAADCAERVLRLFEAHAPDDRRPREAIEGLRAFARGDLRIGEARRLSARAHAAAREAAEPVAVAAARAAGHASATAHMAAHARGASAYSAWAAGLAASDRLGVSDTAAAGAELRWQARRATPKVRAVLRKLPPPPVAGGQVGALMRQLEADLELPR